MGTNYYVATSCEHQGQHIGKRSAAGVYCWDCGITLSRSGNPHDGSGMLEACPKCGQGRQRETVETSAAGRELGFNRAPPARKSGVRSCSSFSWAVEPGYLEGVAEIENEYGDHFTRAEFLALLEECPIRFTHSIGVEFS